ncbi:hypothetical protein ACU6U9_01745 [Pseudomonas sp. HK3]
MKQIIGLILMTANAQSGDLSSQKITKVYVNESGLALIQVSGHSGWLKLGTFNSGATLLT